MKQVLSWLKPKYLIILALIAGIIYLYSKFKSNVIDKVIKVPELKDYSVYQSYANSLYESMRDYGTDEEGMFKILEYLNPDELKMVYKAFGLKNYSSGGKGINLFGINIVGDSLDLFGWFQAELNENERIKMRSIWEKSGLRITF